MEPQTENTPPADNYYPQIEIERNSNPNRLYAIPIIGIFIKFILLIPVFFELWILMIAAGTLIMLINPFVVLATGKYWKMAYDLALGMMRLNAKVGFYLNGVTDKYPGFSISTTPFTWNLAYPETSNRLYAIPILGFLIRTILIIPFAIFSQVISYASSLAVFAIVTPAFVLFKGYYPETAHELAVDSTRLSQASMAYGFGLSDKYPSFKISWNHKNIKIILIIIGVLMLLINLGSSFIPNKQTNPPIQSATESQV